MTPREEQAHQRHQRNTLIALMVGAILAVGAIAGGMYLSGAKERQQERRTEQVADCLLRGDC